MQGDWNFAREIKLPGDGLGSLDMPRTDGGYHPAILAMAGPAPLKRFGPLLSIGRIPLLTRFQDSDLNVSPNPVRISVLPDPSDILVPGGMTFAGKLYNM